MYVTSLKCFEDQPCFLLERHPQPAGPPSPPTNFGASRRAPLLTTVESGTFSCKKIKKNRYISRRPISLKVPSQKFNLIVHFF